MNTNLLDQFKQAGQEVLAPPNKQLVREILAPTDFSDESNAGIHYAVQLAEKLGVGLSLLHVIEPLPVTEGMKGFPLLPTRPEVISKARHQLESLLHRNTRKRVPSKILVRTARAYHGIIKAAAEQNADLIVMATHGYSGVNHALLGSTAERVVRHAPCSVLTVRVPNLTKETALPSLKLERLLVPMDFSDLSKLALPWAVYFGKAFDAEVMLLNVTEKYPIDYLLGPELMNHAISPLMLDAEAALHRIADNLSNSSGLNVSVAVRDGTPHREICQVAEDTHADLIALTTHGYTGLKHVWLGSTAERVVRHARCPVLTVREVGKSPSIDN